MKLNLYTFYISAVITLLSLAPIRNVHGGDVLYEDNFTNLDPSWGTPGDILSVKDGKLILKPALNTTQSVLNQSNVFEDADIAVDVILSTGEPIEPGGLIFWAKDYSNFYCLSIDANGSFNISHFVTDRWLTPVVWTKCEAMNKGIGQVNKLRMVTQGRLYWYPLYIFARRRGYSPDDAQDLTQGFLLHVVEHRAFMGVDRLQGKFRSFLLASFQNHLSDVGDRARRLKRGGDKEFGYLDAEEAEERYRLEPVEFLTAEKIFDARWAMTVLGEALKELRQEYATAGKTSTFEALEALIASEGRLGP